MSMAKPTVEAHADHAIVRFSRTDKVLGVTGDIVIPYSTIERAEVGAPEWPSWRHAFGMGLRAPRLIVKGRIGKLLGPFDRFYWQDRGTTQTLKLWLHGHPKLREVHLDLDSPAGSLADIERQRASKR
jgi:hypothetical protein